MDEIAVDAAGDGKMVIGLVHADGSACPDADNAVDGSRAVAAMAERTLHVDHEIVGMSDDHASVNMGRKVAAGIIRVAVRTVITAVVTSIIGPAVETRIVTKPESKMREEMAVAAKEVAMVIVAMEIVMIPATVTVIVGIGACGSAKEQESACAKDGKQPRQRREFHK